MPQGAAPGRPGPGLKAGKDRVFRQRRFTCDALMLLPCVLRYPGIDILLARGENESRGYRGRSYGPNDPVNL